MRTIITLFIYVSLFCLACGGETTGESSGETGQKKDDTQLLAEATSIQQEAMQKGESLISVMASLQQASNGIQIQGRELTPEETSFTSQIESIIGRYTRWNQSKVEVEPHDHSGHDHSGHNHGKHLELPASDMLIVQKEFRDSIIAIEKDLKGLIQAIPK